MALVDSLKKVSSKVITKFGGDVTVRIVAAGTYDTSDGTISETATDTTIKGILEDVTLRKVDDLVQAGDKRLTVAADDLTTAPETKDRVVISSVVHQIISVETTEQDNTAITYELILRA
tara:strand:- start:653 stop:1009 length:357 start_codon:yes stop_codon:yes gene_type:complete